ncbi:ATP-binding protein [Buttiauxella sp. S04-F03]|uniref:ORC-CDC6 family AAA ATPase n=1 Tax=Buttiauxella sp. S04-F03 TaxID=2904525 RepID=UPI001E54152D|nr:ATP-binding protein [Buttiauxella sp. S04-F03]MCE0813121.1 ATP-binding protein [Buttiauxella sp. S04-F03]
MKLTDEKLQEVIKSLANNIRAERISYGSFLEIYSGYENISNIKNIMNSVIYGRRGSGKTHLLKALAEVISEEFQEKRIFPIYLDLRRIIPLLSSDGLADVDAILIFKYIMGEISYSLYENLNFILDVNEFDSSKSLVKDINGKLVTDYFSKIYLEIEGRTLRKSTDLKVSEEEVRSLNTGLDISRDPRITLGTGNNQKTTKETSHRSHISILDITNSLENLLKELNLNGIMLLIDEWSELSSDIQPSLAEILKKTFSAINVYLKIAAIPNRTALGHKSEKKFIGLEDGGDIFGYHLDLRYVFEVNKTQTRDFFNDLLYRHLTSIDKETIDNFISNGKSSSSSFINLLFANVALNEILVACAGIPRDFINLFLNSYDRFLLSSTSSAKRINVKCMRAANSEWYEKDKKDQVDKNPTERVLLTEIVKEVVHKKKSMHFLIPEEYSNNKHIQNLIDFRVIHLRKNGYSHQDHAGISYNVYSVDYGCYNSLNIAKSKLESLMEGDLNVKDLRAIRRISLEKDFFQRFLINIGEAFYCPNPNCKQAIDVNHPVYIKQNVCNNCWEKIT